MQVFKSISNLFVSFYFIGFLTSSVFYSLTRNSHKTHKNSTKPKRFFTVIDDVLILNMREHVWVMESVVGPT